MAVCAHISHQAILSGAQRPVRGAVADVLAGILPRDEGHRRVGLSLRKPRRAQRMQREALPIKVHHPPSKICLNLMVISKGERAQVVGQASAVHCTPRIPHLRTCLLPPQGHLR